MTFRKTQDQNKKTGQDMTLSMASSTRQEDLAAMMAPTMAAMTRRCSFTFSCVLNCLLSCQTIVRACELVLLSIVMNYAGYVSCMLYCACFGGSPSREAAKTCISKNIKFLYSSVSQ
jgi:hypothetical protein